MAVTYDKISFAKIEQAIKFILDDNFPNVYISPKFHMQGNECIRIDLINSESESLATNFEVRNYNVQVRYYTKADMTKEAENEFIKNRIDKLKKNLIDNQVKNTSSNWSKLEVATIDYNVQDEENEDKDDIYIAELTVLATNYNQF